MSPHLTLAILALLGFCVLTEIVRELSFKRASLGAQVQDGDAPHSVGAHVRSLALQPLLWLGSGFWAVEVVAWIVVLEQAPLSSAYPVMTLTYAGIPLAGALVLRERLTRGQILGAVLVASGVVIVSLAGL